MTRCRAPLMHICCEHQPFAGLQSNEHIMPVVRTVLWAAQAPGGSCFILAAKDAVGRLAPSAMAPASIAIFNSEIRRIVVPIGYEKLSFYRPHSTAQDA